MNKISISIPDDHRCDEYHMTVLWKCTSWLTGPNLVSLSNKSGNNVKPRVTVSYQHILTPKPSNTAAWCLLV